MFRVPISLVAFIGVAVLFSLKRYIYLGDLELFKRSSIRPLLNWCSPLDL